ncbi:hypothetical protein [Sorangium sp. So ce362]|uniref:hypothetical protein n=1 Tax=Sorangium sp. So ce362 TaxID=3133303 RepID=UPI003F60749C
MLNIDAVEATRLLWETYRPYEIWYAFAAAGVVSLVGTPIFTQRSKRWKAARSVGGHDTDAHPFSRREAN